MTNSILFIIQLCYTSLVYLASTNTVAFQASGSTNRKFRSESFFRYDQNNHLSKLQAAIPTWQEIQEALPNVSVDPTATIIDAALPEHQNTPPPYSSDRPTLFRERHGWCPYSERVWLALEHKGILYDTIRIDNTGPGRKPKYFSGQTPQMRWPDGSIQGDSMDLVENLESPNSPSLYPSFQADCIDSSISQFMSIFPSGLRPSSRAAFLFSWNGEPLFKHDFEKTLKRTNELLEDNGSGPFFCGSDMTAADVAWAPFLERYAAQLPCFYESLNPKDPDLYPQLAQWYQAMETTIPAYRCRVMGDESSWRKGLMMAGYGNAGNVPSLIKNRMDKKEMDLGEEIRQSMDLGHSSQLDLDLWKEYSKNRPWLASTPAKEAASVIWKNKDYIVKDVQKFIKAPFNRTALPNGPALDIALRELVSLLLTAGTFQDMENISHNTAVIAAFLDERMCVPRDMGAPCAFTIKRIAKIFDFK